MMELLAPALLALLFILFGLSQRGRSPGGCAACAGEDGCKKNARTATSFTPRDARTAGVLDDGEGGERGRLEPM
jgi:hypothetical protein